MRILVLGAGSVGSALGGFLSIAGHDVTLVGRADHVKSIREKGLIIRGIKGDFRSFPQASVSVQEGEWDVVLVTVKSYDTEAAALALQGMLQPRTIVVHFQNGIGNYETLKRLLPANDVLTGMVIIGFTMDAPGETRITVYGGDMKLGRMRDQPDARVRSVAGLFLPTPLACEAVANIDSWIWAKLFYNAALNALGSVLGVSYGQLVQPAALGLIRAILEEAFAVARAKGVTLFWKDAETYFEYLRRDQIPATAAHMPSMLQDLQRGHRTEVDWINGAIVRMGREVGVPTPVNETMQRQIHFLENRLNS
ncbi:MAG: ketopantoate reductase family protein [Spirochaetia bacterium]|nr:ketopantoate reductase family protein [Spirochaetia bacterium]